MKPYFLFTALLIAMSTIAGFAQHATSTKIFTLADTLRGSITNGRQGWDVLHYSLDVKVDINEKKIIGSNLVTYYETLPVKRMQIDLQAPMIIDSVINDAGYSIPIEKEGNVWWLRFLPDDAMIKFLPGERKIKIYFHGIPNEANNAPWDGGFVWRKDSDGNPWIATAVQGLGASAWWPCKDHQSDEPDRGMTINITVPDILVAVSNGRLIRSIISNPGFKTWEWKVVNPINNYGVSLNIGKYVSWNDTLQGEAGKLDLQYWVLANDLEKAKKQFEQVKPMLHCFEYWFGKYPFYEDGYKLVQTPYLGMEHQSAIAYGNRFKNGYLGFDRSGTGWGSKWDYIIVHESGHEWFGNNITSTDIADMWIHEGFTDYSETLYTECMWGKQAGIEYIAGFLGKVSNDRPIIGNYGVNNPGSGDMYVKGAFLLQVIRNTINNDEKFRTLLRNLNNQFFHKTVTTEQVENFINKKSGINFSKVFDQYLRTTKVPQLEYYFSKKNNLLHFRWSNVVDGFSLPLYINSNKKNLLLSPTGDWKKITNNNYNLQQADILSLEKKYYISTRQLKN